MRSYHLRLPALGLTLLALGSAGLARAGLVADLQAGAVFDDNVNQSERGVERLDDFASSISGSAGGRFQISKNGSLTLAGTFESLDFRDFNGLDRWSPGGTVSLRQKIRFGARAPWLQVSGSASHEEFRDGAREGWLYQTKAGYGWHAGALASLAVEGSYLLRSASATVFDQNAFGLSFRADVALRENAAVYAAYQIRRGDVTSSSMPDPAARASAKERAVDPVFGRSFIVYRLEATSHDARVGINFAMGHHAAIDLSYEALLALAADGIDYGVHQVRGRFLYRF